MLYWYISAENVNRNGKVEQVLDGPYDTEKLAQEAGFKVFPGLMFKKHQFPTRDRGKATAMFKHSLAGDIGAFNAIRPVRHSL